MRRPDREIQKEKIDGLFLPHCNFGTEYECARLAKDLNVPVLLWGPLDERPEPNGVRLRDTHRSCFTPEMDNTEREARYNGWQKAVRQVLTH